jgi:hypothetical protein
MPRSRNALKEQKQLLRLALRADAPPERAGRGRAAAEYAVVVAHLVDEPHPHLRARLRAALAALARRDRQFLRLRVGLGHTGSAVRQALGLGSRVSLDVRVEALLADLARTLWAQRLRSWPEVQSRGTVRRGGRR